MITAFFALMIWRYEEYGGVVLLPFTAVTDAVIVWLVGGLVA